MKFCMEVTTLKVTLITPKWLMFELLWWCNFWTDWRISMKFCMEMMTLMATLMPHSLIS
jgi:hypothetical protein